MEMEERKCCVGLVQSCCGPDVAQNQAKTLAGIREAAKRGATIVCTQELFQFPYFCQREETAHFQLAEAIPGPTTERLQAEAKSLGVAVIASLFERRAPGLYHNTAVFVDENGRLAGKYRKMHIPEDPGFHEKYYFAPGDLGVRVWQTRFAAVGVLLCWDQWYPEAARLAALQGAEILFFPTAIGWLSQEKPSQGALQVDSWETIQRAHAIANGCYVAAVNRVGVEDPHSTGGIEFWGGSFVAGTSGEILARASQSQEQILTVEIDLNRIQETRTAWPFLRDRRPDAYQDILQRFKD